jgi:hypothetical protein
MKSKSKAPLLILAVMMCQSAAFAQSSSTAPSETISPAELAPPLTNVQIKTGSAQEFLSSMALKFGTSVKRLQSLLAKLPPHGKGLNPIEIKVIAGKLHLSKEDKEAFKTKVGAGGTGFNSQDIAAMSAQLGLTSEEASRLSQELGLSIPAVATPAIAPVPVGSTGSGM